MSVTTQYRISMYIVVTVLMMVFTDGNAQDKPDELTVPIVVDGQTQVIPEFKDRDLWIRHDLWVETEFDSDGDGKPDRMHVDVTRPCQTESLGLKLPVIYISSPYFGGKGAEDDGLLWDVRHELGPLKAAVLMAQAQWTNHRLLYVTSILTKPVHLSGTPHITIRLASSKPAANLSVWLVSLPWTEGRNTKITDNIITRGWADPQNYRSLTESEPLTQGRFYEMSFDLQPDDQVILRGQQIGLMIFSSDKDFTLWPTPGTKLTVDLDATTLTLPVVGGVDAFSEAVQKKPSASEKAKEGSSSNYDMTPNPSQKATSIEE